MNKTSRPLMPWKTLAFIALLCVTLGPALHAAQYDISILTAPDDNASNEAQKITSNGLVFTVDYGARSWAIWNPNTGLNEIPFSDDSIVLRGINSSGKAVGQRNYDTAIMIDPNGQIHDLPSLTGPTGAWANAINDTGLIVGYSSYNAVLWQADGTPIALAGTLSAYAVARAISENGLVMYTQDEVIGGALRNRSSYIWKPDGSTQQLALLPGSEGISSGGRAINNSGQVVGTSAGHAILWNPDGSIAADLGNGAAFDINNLGQIVGTLDGHAVMWEADGSIVDLPLPSADAWAEAVSINDDGQIAGTAFYDAPGIYHTTAVLWQPVPEPSSIIVLFCGIGALAGHVARRRTN